MKNIFEAMITTIYTALEVGLDVAVHPTLLEENIDEVEEMSEFLYKLGVKYLRLVQKGRFFFDFQRRG